MKQDAELHRRFAGTARKRLRRLFKFPFPRITGVPDDHPINFR